MKWLKRIGIALALLVGGFAAVLVWVFFEYCGKYHHFIC